MQAAAFDENLNLACLSRPQVLWKSRALLGAYRLLFSTSDTSTIKIGFSKPPIECWEEPRLRSVKIVQDLAAVNKYAG
jgi:hypothetical protein